MIEKINDGNRENSGIPLVKPCRPFPRLTGIKEMKGIGKIRTSLSSISSL
jgi:hypothetical protein